MILCVGGSCVFVCALSAVVQLRAVNRKRSRRAQLSALGSFVDVCVPILARRACVSVKKVSLRRRREEEAARASALMACASRLLRVSASLNSESLLADGLQHQDEFSSMTFRLDPSHPFHQDVRPSTECCKRRSNRAVWAREQPKLDARIATLLAELHPCCPPAVEEHVCELATVMRIAFLHWAPTTLCSSRVRAAAATSCDQSCKIMATPTLLGMTLTGAIVMGTLQLTGTITIEASDTIGAIFNNPLYYASAMLLFQMAPRLLIVLWELWHYDWPLRALYPFLAQNAPARSMHSHHMGWWASRGTSNSL